MTAERLDGKALAEQMQQQLRQQVARFVEAARLQPMLAAVLVGEEPASQVYVRNKSRACQRVGIESQIHRLPNDTSPQTLSALIADLNANPRVHGILVQLPLPPQIDATSILDAVDPLKDVDGFHPENVGLIAQGRPRFLPCTPHAVIQLLHRSGIQVAGKEVVVVGRSDIVGKPLAMMLAQRDSLLGPTAVNATVTICHSRTAHLAEVTRRGDVLIAAIGQPKFVTAEMIKPGAAVVDVGINRTDDGLVGDVDFAAVQKVARWITPVPGGVGPLTVTMLLYNTLAAARFATS